MKRSQKILSIALALLMVVPMFVVFVPLEASAASKAAHTVFNTQLTFEDAIEGSKLSENYLNRRMDTGFTSTTPSDTDNDFRRNPSNYTVVSETIDGVTNKYIQPNGAYNASMPTFYDETGVTWRQPWQLTFKVKGENGSIITNAAEPSGHDWGALVAVAATNNAADKRVSLLYAYDRKLCFDGYGNAPFCQLAKNQWHEITVNVDPATGVVDFRVKQVTFDTENETNVLTKLNNGTAQADGSITGSRTVSNIKTYAAGNPTGGVVSMGRFYGSSIKVDFCYDDISLHSVLKEHVDFEGALIRNAGVVDVYPLENPKYFMAKDMSLCTPGETQTSAFALVEGTNGNMYHMMELNGLCGGTCGMYTDTTKLVTEGKDFVISAKFMHDGKTFNNAFNAVRFLINGSDKYTPLNLNYGRVGIRGDSGIALFRRTETDGVVSYSTIQMTANEWYQFDLKFNVEKWTYQVYLNGELLYLKGSYDAATNTATYPLDVSLPTSSKTYSELTDADMTSTLLISALGGKTPTSKLSVYFMYGTSNFGTSGTVRRFYADDYKISNTEAGGSYNKVVDFNYTPEIPAEKVDWWHYSDFENSWTKSAGTAVKSTLQDWDVVPDPAGKKGNVLHRFKASTDTTAGAHAAGAPIFSVRDVGNVLPSYLVDISFDMRVASRPSTNINLFKIYPTGAAAESRDNTNSFTLAQYHSDGKLYMMDNNNRVSGTLLNLNTWYNVRFRINFIEGWYEMYFNGSDTPYSFTVNNETKTRQTFTATRAAADNFTYSPDMLNKLQFEIYSTYKAAISGDCYIDNVKIESVGMAEQPRAAIPEFVEYDLLAADFEDSAWLTAAEAGEIPYLKMDYTKASILDNVGLADNNALCLTGTKGGAMTLDLFGMGGYHNTFSVEMSMSYGNIHGSALDLVTIADAYIGKEKTLLSVMGDNAKDDLTGAIFFNDDGNRYYLCDSAGNLYHSDGGNAEAATLIDVAVVVDAESNSYAIYVNQKPAYYTQYGNAGRATRAANIPLGLVDGNTMLLEPVLSLISCSADTGTVNRVLVDNIRVASVKNGLTPVLVGYQENTMSGTALRFLATVDTLYYEEMGFIVEAKGVTKTFSTTTVFTSVTAGSNTVVAKELDGRYITALVVSDINESPVEFTVTPYAVFFGREIRGESKVITYTAE